MIFCLIPDAKSAESKNEIFPYIEQAIFDFSLVENDEFIKKTAELFELLQVRHGNMIVGGALTGKSTMLNVLAEAVCLYECAKNTKDSKKTRKVSRV